MSFYLLKKQFSPFAVFLFFTQILLAQTPTQTVRGRVVDIVNAQPLVGANVQLLETDFSTASDTEGVFKIEKIPVGRYTLKVSFIGFETTTIAEFWVQSGKEVTLDINLMQSTNVLETVNVQAYHPPICKCENFQINNSEPFTRYAATFNDPARAITYLPGAATDNDQGNNISVRGNTPNALQWYLEGAEIVNPNHLSNAGTPSDRTTANGGGVLILGANMMESATFYKGAMSADKGGALTSIMDLNLRKGNDNKRQTSISLGLIGTEAGTEGYFSPPTPRGGDKGNSPSGGRRASYLVHYRYSTVGLLSKMGVPLGDETITYQDLTYNFNFPTQKAGNFNLFGMHGFSDNVFKNKPKAEWTTEKDSQDIIFKNQMNVVGLKHSVGLGKKAIWHTVVAYSWLKNNRDAMGFDGNKTLVASENIENNHAKLFFKTKVDWQLGQGTLQAGLSFKDENIEMPYVYKIGSTNSQGKTSGHDSWIQPFAEWNGKAGEKLQYRMGLRLSALTKANNFELEPSMGVQYSIENNGDISLNFSRQSQSLSPIVYAFPAAPLNSKFHITESNNVNLNYHYAIKNKVGVDFGLFYQLIESIPQAANSLTALDELDNLRVSYSEITNLAKSRNIGAEIDFNGYLLRGYHWRLNSTIYNSIILPTKGGSTSIGKERNSRYNGRYIVNALAGKEWTVGKNQNKFWGINGHILGRGGFRETPIDEVASKKANQTVYDYTKPFSLQLKDYFRTDVSVYFKRNRLKWSSTLQLDIQNVTNQQNEAWHYFDRFQKKVVTKYQLGMIPNLSYKVDF